MTTTSSSSSYIQLQQTNKQIERPRVNAPRGPDRTKNEIIHPSRLQSKKEEKTQQRKKADTEDPWGTGRTEEKGYQEPELKSEETNNNNNNNGWRFFVALRIYIFLRKAEEEGRWNACSSQR